MKRQGAAEMKINEDATIRFFIFSNEVVLLDQS